MVRSFKSIPQNGRSRRFKVVSDRVADARANAFQALRSKGAKAKRSVSKPSFVRQLKALVASKKKDAADVSRNTDPQTTTTLQCLTSTTNFATAASGTGLLDLDGDECLINSVQIRCNFSNATTVLLDPTATRASMVRNIVVWFNKPLLVASAAGTLPPITEVLVTDSFDSLYVTPAANGGRFVVLSDKTFNLGINTVASTGGLASRVEGTTTRPFTYFVKVNKMCKFKANSVSGTPAGHYDSDVAAGQIDRGLLVMYTMVISSGATLNIHNNTRLNYTG